MIYLGNRKLYEDIIFIIAHNVKSLVEQLDCQSLNESVDYYNDLLSGFLYETGCNVRGYLKSLNERQKWDEESVRKFVEDNDIKSRSELWTKNGNAYKAARRIGILNDLFGEKIQSKPITKWTEESIRQFVKNNNIKTRSDLATKAHGAYYVARQLGILNDLFGEKELKWTEESIRQFVKDNDIKTRKELAAKARGAYNVAKQLGILDDLFGEKELKWTKENCAELAAKCKYRSDFRRQYPRAYIAAVIHGWLDDIVKHMPKQKGYVLISNHNYIVYVYEDIENKAAYVGLTNDIKRRDWQHRFPTSKGYDSLGLWCINHDIPVPQPKILENNLTAKEAGEKEEEYWYKYRDEGWTMINTEKALGSLGGSPRKWTKKTIKKYINDNDIKTRKELQTKASGAYQVANKLGILNDLFGENTNKWTEESIIQFVKDNNIKTRKELETKASGAYQVANKLGILDDLFGESKRKEKNYWTEESIRQFVEDNNIKTRKELLTKVRGAYNAAQKLGILNDLFGERVAHNKKWTEESIRQFVKDNNIKTRKGLETKAIGAYKAARQLSILDKLFPKNN